MNKWIILDAMGVIFQEGKCVDNLLIPFLKRYNPLLHEDKVREAYLQFSLGQMVAYDFWKTVRLEKYYPTIEKEYLDTQFTLDPELFGLIKLLAPEYKFAYLSNHAREWSDYLIDRFELRQYFEVFVVSGQVHARKPSDAIFEHLLERTEVPPEMLFYVDDQQKNITAAEKFGINAILYGYPENSDSYDSLIKLGKMLKASES